MESIMLGFLNTREVLTCLFKRNARWYMDDTGLPSYLIKDTRGFWWRALDIDTLLFSDNDGNVHVPTLIKLPVRRFSNQKDQNRNAIRFAIQSDIQDHSNNDKIHRRYLFKTIVDLP